MAPNGCSPSCIWGLTHINMSGEDGSKERACRNGDEQRRRWKGKIGISHLKWDYKDREKEKENRSGQTDV